MFDTTVTLLQETITQDEALNEVKTYEERTVPVRQARSITRSEFYQAAAQGLKPAAVLVVFFGDYQNEQLVRWQGRYYAITRAYQRPASDNLELTIQEQLSTIGGVDTDDDSE